jgi:hypothetical protein
MSYCMVQSNQPVMLFKLFKMLENFVDFQVYEDAAPLSTLECSFQIILLEYTEILMKNQLQSDGQDPMLAGQHKDALDEQINTISAKDMNQIFLSIECEDQKSRGASGMRFSFSKDGYSRSSDRNSGSGANLASRTSGFRDSSIKYTLRSGAGEI